MSFGAMRSRALVAAVVASAAGPRAAEATLRGYADPMAARAEMEDTYIWYTFGDHRVADNEGEGIRTMHAELETCQWACRYYEHCHSFAWCPGTCYLKDGKLNATTPHHRNAWCTTYYLGPPTTTTTYSEESSAPPTTAALTTASPTTTALPTTTTLPPTTTIATTTVETTTSAESVESAETTSPSEPPTTTTLPATSTTTTLPATVTTTSTTAARTSTTVSAVPTTTVENFCYEMHSSMRMSDLQEFGGNLEAAAEGYVHLWLCTNGSMTGSLTVEGAASDIIAAQIHRCEGGDTPQTQINVLCTGPPVAVFCGDNDPGMMSVGMDYTGPCGALASGRSETENMTGAIVPRNTEGETAADVVLDIVRQPEKYFFNVYSALNKMHWHPQESPGMIRGELGLVVPTTTTTMRDPTTPDPSTGPRPTECFTMFSQLVTNELQQYPNNPEADVTGYADITLCTNGTLRSDVIMFKGVSPIIAMHVHKCSGGDTPDRRFAELCEGATVVLFCGENIKGLLTYDVPYPETCSPRNKDGVARMDNMVGVMTKAKTPEEIDAQVRHIYENPNSYYFNVHSMASYTQWFPGHKGMSRGAMDK